MTTESTDARSVEEGAIIKLQMGRYGLTFAGYCKCGEPIFLSCNGCHKHPSKCDCGTAVGVLRRARGERITEENNRKQSEPQSPEESAEANLDPTKERQP